MEMRDWFELLHGCEYPHSYERASDAKLPEEFTSLCEACKHRRSADRELLPNGLTPKENYLVTIGRRIDAIKSLRARRCMGLREAKVFIDQAEIVQMDDL